MCRARLRAEAAGDDADEAAVHRAAHDVAEDRARRADQRAGDDHGRVVEREPHRRRRPARIAVQHRHHDRHVGAADGNDEQEAEREGEPGHDPEIRGRLALVEARPVEDHREQDGEVDPVPRGQEDGLAAHVAVELQERDHGA
jgi:hypothetical protein